MGGSAGNVNLDVVIVTPGNGVAGVGGNTPRSHSAFRRYRTGGMALEEVVACPL